MKTIIVSTDFSAPATNAMEYAIAVAQKCNAKLVVFNSFEPPVPSTTGSVASPGIHKMLNQNKTRLEKLAIFISSNYGILVDWVTNISYVDEELEKQVKRLGADLVVMGMGGDSLDRKLFGSVTTSVIRSAKFPVLVIPEGVSFQGIDKILFACDYQFIPTPPQLAALSHLGRKFQSHVQFLHVETKEASYETPGGWASGKTYTLPLEEAMEGLIHSYREIKDPDIMEGIKKGVRDFNADLLVMVPHKTGFLDVVFNRSITKKMALNTHIPLLTIPYAVDKKEKQTQKTTSTSRNSEKAATDLSPME